MRRVPAFAIAILVTAALNLGCGGDDPPLTLNVPSDHPNIQAAVDAARPGDLILSAPGT